MLEKLSLLADKIMSLDTEVTSSTLFSQMLEMREGELLGSLREQLYDGKFGNGANITPSYSEDIKANGGFFTSVEKANAYAAWKNRITPSPRRDMDTPNLFITGRFHDEIGINFSSDSFSFVGTTTFARDIMARYGEENFGLTDERMEEIMESSKDDIKEIVLSILLNG